MEGKLDTEVFHKPGFLEARVQKSAKPLVYRDVLTVMERYIYDAEHFINFAPYASKAHSVLSDDTVRRTIRRKMGTKVDNLIQKNLGVLIQGGLERRAAMLVDNRINTWIRDIAAITISDPKQFARQALGFAVAVPKVGVSNMLWAIGDITSGSAFRDGRIKRLTNTPYMITRHAGSYDLFQRLSKIQADADILNAGIGKNVFSQVKGTVAKARANETLWALLRMAPRYGDRTASLLAGWAAMHKAEVEIPGMPESFYTDKAIEVIEATQQSMDVGRLPVEYSLQGGANPLLLLFGRFNAQYVENYAQTMGAMVDAIKNRKEWKGKSRVEMKDVVNTVLTYHVFVPMLEAWFASALSMDPDDWWDKFTVYAPLGPGSNILFIGDLLKAVSSWWVKQNNPDANIPSYMTDTSVDNIIESTMGEIKNSIIKLGDEPDFYDILESAAAVAEPAFRLPIKTPTIAVDAVNDYVSGEYGLMDTLRRVLGWSEKVVEANQE
jgi:hypothetical protein